MCEHVTNIEIGPQFLTYFDDLCDILLILDSLDLISSKHSTFYPCPNLALNCLFHIT